MFERLRRNIVWIGFACCVGAAQAAGPVRDAQEILAASDAVRNPGKPFALLNALTEYRNGEERSRTVLQVYSRADDRTGQYRSLVRFVEPARDANKLMLRNGQDLWFYDPASKASVRISPQQRLLGQASNGDVATVNLARDYRARLAGEETVTDVDKARRDTYRLELTAAMPDANYARVDYWVERGDLRPIKARFYADSGRLLKTAYYRGYAQQLGRERPTETVIIDGLDPGWVTVMRFSGYAYRDVPESWLQRDYLARFRPE